MDTWWPETNTQTLPTRLPPMERQQKEPQYPGWHKNTTKKGMWNEDDNEVPWGDKDVRGNIEITGG